MLSVEERKQSISEERKDPYTWITITVAGKSVAYSVPRVTQDSESSSTIHFVLRMPLAISAERDQQFYQKTMEILALHLFKGADYGELGDPFANIRASQDFGITPWIGAMVRLNDKVHRIKSLIANRQLRNEPLTDSLQDIAVYALIALILYEEGANCLTPTNPC